MFDRAVIFDHVSKRFSRGERHNSLRDLIPALTRSLLRRPASGQDEFWAVRDVSFELEPGEALGIIGPNGAGKSTILKLLTKILRPTHGRAEIHGRVGALIEVAAGFHPDLTGRENVFLQGAIMGMHREEITRKFDEIVAFSGVSGEFIDTPVKRYSSGMNARLGFAIAAHLDPDVLIIDEILSVGDAVFQEKCVTRMKSLVDRGVPLVFVSHNLPAVLHLCTRSILLVHGQVAFDGAPDGAVREYLSGPWARPQGMSDQPPEGAEIYFESIELLDDKDRKVDAFRTGDPVTVRMHYRALHPVTRPHFAIDILRGDLTECATLTTHIDGLDFGVVTGRGYVDVVIPRLPFLPGVYTMTFSILKENAAAFHDRREYAYPFSIIGDRHRLGLVHIDHDWKHQVVSNAPGARVLPYESGASIKTHGVSSPPARPQVEEPGTAWKV
jgi:lipopolysaccharide transport system ATP-binding protein